MAANDPLRKEDDHATYEPPMVDKAEAALIDAYVPCKHLATRACVECRRDRLEEFCDNYAEALIEVAKTAVPRLASPTESKE